MPAPSPATTPRACARCSCAAPGGRRGRSSTRPSTPPRCTSDLAAVRREELARATEIIGYDEVVMLGLPGLGHGRFRGQRQPGLLRRRPAGGGHRAPRGDRPPDPSPGHGDLRRRPDRLPPSRPPAGARRRPGRIPGRRRPGPVPGGRTRLPAVEALLHRPLGGPVPRHPRQVRGTGPGVALRRRVAGPVGHHARRGADRGDRHHRLHRRAPARPAGPRHPGRSRVEVLVRPAARGDGHRSSPTTTTGWPSSATRRHRDRALRGRRGRVGPVRRGPVDPAVR